MPPVSIKAVPSDLHYSNWAVAGWWTVRSILPESSLNSPLREWNPSQVLIICRVMKLLLGCWRFLLKPRLFRDWVQSFSLLISIIWSSESDPDCFNPQDQPCALFECKKKIAPKCNLNVFHYWLMIINVYLLLHLHLLLLIIINIMMMIIVVVVPELNTKKKGPFF